MGKKLGRSCRWGLLVSIVSVILLSPFAAATTTSLQLQIQPLECSIDTLNSGINILTQLSPNCTSDGDEPGLLEGEEPREPTDSVSATVTIPFEDDTHPLSSSERFFYVPFRTGYDSVSPLQPSEHDDITATTQGRYSDAALSVIVVAIVTAGITTAMAQGGFSWTGISRLLRKARHLWR